MEALFPILAIAFLLALFAAPQLLFRRWLFWGGRLFFSPREFATEYARQLGFEVQDVPRSWRDWLRPVRALERVRVAGALESGRHAHVHFAARRTYPQPNRPLLQAGLAVEATEAPPIRISRELLRNKLAKLVGLQKDIDTGDRAFDAKFLVKAGDEPRARSALAQEMRDLISTAFDRHGVSELVFENGVLSAFVTLSSLARPLSRNDGKGGVATPTRELFSLLDRIARAFDRVSLDVRVLGGTRRALLGLAGKPRCAYCHEGVTGDEPDLVACDRCATICHEGCWNEHGSCPVLGCSGGHPERAAPGATPTRAPERA